MKFKNKKAFVITTIFIMLTLTVFWQDRYGALINKANSAIAGDWKIEEKISLDAGWVKNSPFYSWEKRSFYTFLNWTYANRKGMTFGVIFAALILTLFSFVQISSRPKNKYQATVYGLLLGTPLGVCSNCVAPISKSFFESGLQKTTALASMFASPTLNLVVLFIVFSIFPFPIALIKVAATFILILVILPFLVGEENITQVNNVNIYNKEIVENWQGAFITFLKKFTKRLWYVFSRTVPLMALGGLFGATISNIIDLNILASTDNYFSLFVLSIIGTFLPVPMAFDVFYSESLMTLNVPLSSVTTLLATLGTFSVFSFAIVWQTFGKKIAFKLFVAVVLLGFIAGSVVKILNIHTDSPTYSVQIL
jgi:uncharacterized membrane protein YraQ (UPF0718 family)